jgi:prepilin-type N-terminal cleavage/methylation domain-containing protein
MKNEKGFTLVELITVISLLVLITLITVPAVNKAIERSENKAYEAQKSAILSAAKQWNLENVGNNPGNSKINYDVTFALDVSKRMDDTNIGSADRDKSTVEAINDMVNYLFATNNKNRISLVTFGSNVQTILPLSYYKFTGGTTKILTYTDNAGNYNDTFTISPNVFTQVSTLVDPKTITFNEDYSYMQGGIMAATNNLVTESSGNIPVLIVITGGSPSKYCSNINTLLLEGCSTSTGESLLTDYYTITGAQNYKNMLNQQVSKKLKVYTLGMNLNGNNKAQAVINPISSLLNNYTELDDMLTADTNPVKIFNYADKSTLETSITKDTVLNIFKSMLDSQNSNIQKLQIQTLIDDGYLDKNASKNPKDGKVMNGYVEIAYNEEKDKYTYSYIEE